LIKTVDHGLQLLSGLQTKNVRLLLDLFHMNIEEVSVADSIRDAGAAVGHIHWVDSNRRAATLGHMDLSAVAKALKDIDFKGYVSAEVLPLPNSYEAARKTIESYRNLILG
jgi:sugar phosphate isomerase/epimerase